MKVKEFFAKAKQKKDETKEKIKTWLDEHPKIHSGLIVGSGLLIYGGLAAGAVALSRKQKADYDQLVEQSCDEVLEELNRMEVGPGDYIDDEGKYHQDIGFGCFAVWNSSEDYLNAETKRIERLKNNN